MRIAAVIFYLIMIAPVQLDLYFYADEKDLPHGFVCAALWGFSHSLRYHVEKREQEFILCIGRKSKTLKGKINRKKRNNALFMPLKKEIKKLIALFHFRLYALIGLKDAANTAVACGTLNAIFGIFPYIKASIRPYYQAKGYALFFHCIAEFRLGTLFLTFLQIGIASAVRILSGGNVNGNHQRSKNQLGHADGP